MNNIREEFACILNLTAQEKIPLEMLYTKFCKAIDDTADDAIAE